MNTRKNTVYKKSNAGFKGHGLFEKKTGWCILFISSSDANHFIESEKAKIKKDGWHLSLIKYANKAIKRRGGK